MYIIFPASILLVYICILHNHVIIEHTTDYITNSEVTFTDTKEGEEEIGKLEEKNREGSTLSFPMSLPRMMLNV